MRVHIIRGAKPITNRKLGDNWIQYRDTIYEPLKKGHILSPNEINNKHLEYYFSSTYPLFFSDAAAYDSLIIHEDLLPIFEIFNIQKHALLPLKVMMKEQSLSYYFFNYQGILTRDDIDFLKSEFAYYKSGHLEKDGIQFKDYEEYVEAKKATRNLDQQQQYRIHKLVFNGEQNNQLDFFYLGCFENRMVISDRMLAEILKLKHKKVGLEFVDFLTVHVSQISSQETAFITAEKEEPETLHFGSITNSTIESRIVNRHKILMSYFGQLNIQQELDQDVFTSNLNINPSLLKNYNTKYKQILNLYNAAPLPSLVETAKSYYNKLTHLIKESNLQTEIIILGTSFENQCFYTDHLIHTQNNTQIDIGKQAFYLTYNSDNNVPFDNLPFLDVLQDDDWLEQIEAIEHLPCIEKLIAIYHNALWMMFYKTFQLAYRSIDTRPIALSLEYYDKEDLDFIYI